MKTKKKKPLSKTKQKQTEIREISPVDGRGCLWRKRFLEKICLQCYYYYMNYLLLNLNSINETLLSVLYFSTYDCVYTDLVLSGCVVIFKIFTNDFSVMCILFMYCCKHVRLTCV